MLIPTEPIGSIPRRAELIAAFADRQAGGISPEAFDAVAERALLDTIKRFEETGSPVITDGEQTKPSFATYPINGATNLDPNGIVIPFKDGHTRQLPKLKSGPFRYQTFASDYYTRASAMTRLPLKQAVISASALGLLYPAEGIEGYSKEQFLTDLYQEQQKDIRQCLAAGAVNVQID